MVIVKTISMPNWIYEEIEENKPDKIGNSEWMVELMAKGLKKAKSIPKKVKNALSGIQSRILTILNLFFNNLKFLFKQRI